MTFCNMSLDCYRVRQQVGKRGIYNLEQRGTYTVQESETRSSYNPLPPQVCILNSQLVRTRGVW